jgi:hypothetical protein
MPAVSVLAPLAGRYLDRSGPMTLDVSVDAAGSVLVGANGTQMTVKASEDGRLVAGKGSFALLIQPAGEGLEVELPSGHRQSFVRLGAEPPLPAGLDGVYRCPDMSATWTIMGCDVSVQGPLVGNSDWSVAGVDGDFVRIHMPSVLFQGWLDVRIQRDEAGAVASLFVNGGRAKGLIYTRVSAR